MTETPEQPHRHEVRTYPSGTYIDLLLPLTDVGAAADAIRIEDVAHHLALANRYAGGTVAPYTVAQHSVLVSRHVGDDPMVQLQALLHDAPEYLLHDVSGPLKKWAGMDGYRRLEQAWWEAFAKRFGVLLEMHPNVKRADKRALNTEKRDLRGGPSKERTPEPFAERIEPWGWEQARDAFLARARELDADIPASVRGMVQVPLSAEEADLAAAIRRCPRCTGQAVCDEHVPPEKPDPVPYEDATGDSYPAPGVWVNPDRCGGQPCIEGHRIPTITIANHYAAGNSFGKILNEYPSINREQLEAALRYELHRLLEAYEPEPEGDDSDTCASCGHAHAWASTCRSLGCSCTSFVDQKPEGEDPDDEGPERKRSHCGSGRLCNVGACSCNCQPCRRADRVEEKQAAFDAEHRRRPVVSDLREPTVEERLEHLDAATAGAIGELFKRLDAAEHRFEDHAKRLDGISRDVGQCERAVEDLTGTPAGKPLRERVDAMEQRVERLAALSREFDRPLLRKVQGNGRRIEQLNRSVGPLKSRIDQLERDLAKLRAGGAPESRREHATAAFAYLCGRMGKPLDFGESPVCGEPIPDYGMRCPYPKPCPFHTGEQRGTEAAE